MGGSPSTKKQVYSVEVPGSARPGCSPIYVNPNSKAYLMVQNPFGDTLYETFNSATTRFSNLPYLGTRVKLESGFGKYEWLTYGQIHSKAQKIGWALAHLGFSKKNEEGLSFLGIYSKNRLEWILIDQACINQDIVTVPIYETLQSNSLQYIFNQTQMRVIACDDKSTPKVIKLVKNGDLQSLQLIIQFEEVSNELSLEGKNLGIEILSILQLENLVSSGTDNPPTPSSILTICYTSGTTGQSKGVMIRHSNVVYAMTGMMGCNFIFDSSDVHLSYLPLPHIMERTSIYYYNSFGMSIGFFQGDILKIREDLAELKPTIFPSVPRLFNRFYDVISQQLSSLTGGKKLLVSRALASKQYYYRTQGLLTHKLWDTLVFQKIKNLFGGRIKKMTSGSAPLSPKVAEFLKIVFSCPLIEGYGQTETCAVFVTSSEETKTGIVGGPVKILEVKLKDVPEMDYRTTDVDENGSPAPRGEICVRGLSVFAGYYKNPQITAEAFDEEGWLSTGDVGMRHSDDGSFRIIDRIKNFFKLQQGEYVSAEKVELVYVNSPFVMQIFVYGDSNRNFLVAVVVPDEGFVRKSWNGEGGLDEKALWKDVCASEGLNKRVLADMDEKAKEFGLLGFEVVKRIHLEPVPWTSEDLLTPTQKLMRFQARKRYESVIEKLYLD